MDLAPGTTQVFASGALELTTIKAKVHFCRDVGDHPAPDYHSQPTKRLRGPFATVWRTTSGHNRAVFDTKLAVNRTEFQLNPGGCCYLPRCVHSLPVMAAPLAPHRSGRSSWRWQGRRPWRFGQNRFSRSGGFSERHSRGSHPREAGEFGQDVVGWLGPYEPRGRAVVLANVSGDGLFEIRDRLEDPLGIELGHLADVSGSVRRLRRTLKRGTAGCAAYFANWRHFFI
jgi:hypothetical protein